MFEELLQGWDGEEVVTSYDRLSQTWMFVGVHSTVLGPGFGGTRMKVYPHPAEGLRDVLRLSSAMTSKNALAGLPFGGGKAVLAVPAIPVGDERRRLLLRYADVVASLGGTYHTACDMNTTEADMDVVAERCPYVMGRSVAQGGSGSSGPATATGVFHGILASVRHAFGSDDLHGRSVLVQGVGDVGGSLAALLADAGADVLVTDVVTERAQEVAGRVAGRAIPPDEAVGAGCDIFAPCATGAILNEETIPKLESRVVAGAANNQLATEADADRLREAGILYAPDYVINAGGVLSLAGLERLGWTGEQLEQHLRGITDTLAEVFRIADAEGITPNAAAKRMVRERLAAATR